MNLGFSQRSSRKRQIAWRINLPIRSNSPWSEHVKAFSQDSKPVSVTISSDTVLKALFFCSINAFRTQEWFNLATDDVLRLRKTPPLVTILLGWLLAWFGFTVLIL
jgi:hypothetical protein